MHLKMLPRLVLMVVIGATFAGCRCKAPLEQAQSELRVETKQRSFGEVYLGTIGTGVVALSNAGRASLTVALETSAPFSISETPVVLGGGERREIEVHFTPVAAGAASGVLKVASFTVALDGVGLEIPSCAQEPCAGSSFSLEEKRCVRTQRADDTACDPGCGASGLCFSGQCLAQNAGQCDDGNPCTIDACGSDGGCVAFPRECPVSNACLVASCDPAVGCTEAPVEDGVVCGTQLCSQVQICLDGACQTRPTPSAYENCTYVDVSAHGASVCAKNLAGVARCWGNNANDRLLRGASSTSVAPAPWNVGFEVARFVGSPEVCALDASGRLRCPNRFDAGDDLYADFASFKLCGVLTDGGLSTCIGLPDAGRALLTPARRTWAPSSRLSCAQGVDGGVGCWGPSWFFSDAPDAGSAFSFDMMPFAEPPRDLYPGQAVWALMPDGGVEIHGNIRSFFQPLSLAPSGQHAWAGMGVDNYSAYFAWGLLEDGSIEACPVTPDDAGVGQQRVCSPLPGAHTFQKLTPGDAFACGLDTDGGVWCWGYNNSGSLGEPTVAQEPRTLPMTGVLFYDRGVACFSDGGCETVPAGVPFAPPGPVDDVCYANLSSRGAGWSVAADGSLSPLVSAPGAVLLPAGTAYQTCDMQAPQADGTVARVDGFSERWNCTLRSDGGTDCEGLTDGTLGFGPRDAGLLDVLTTHIAAPAAVALRTNGFGACVLTTAGRVWCWGDSLGAPVPREEPLFSVRQLECTTGACCALRGENGVSCWGENWANQLGSVRPDSANPVAIAIDEPVLRLSHSAQCAVLRSGRVRCWSGLGADAPQRSDIPLRVVR